MLGPYIAAHPRLAGRRAAARELMRWAALGGGTASVWMRRAGMTAFVGLVSAVHGGGGRQGVHVHYEQAGRGVAGGSGSGGGGLREDAREGEGERGAAGEETDPCAGRSGGATRGRGDEEEQEGHTNTATTAGGSKHATAAAAAGMNYSARGGDELFGEGFIVELSAACGSAIGQGDGASFNVNEDLAAWVQTGAQWMLSLCARESRRMDSDQRKRKDVVVEGGAAAAAPPPPTTTTQPKRKKKSVTWGEDLEEGGFVSAEEGGSGDDDGCGSDDDDGGGGGGGFGASVSGGKRKKKSQHGVDGVGCTSV